MHEYESPPKHLIQNTFLRILCFYILPFIIFNSIIFYLVTVGPKYEITLGDTNDYINTSFTLEVTSAFPYKSLSVSLEGETIELEKTDKNTFTASVNKNGILEISMINFNGMPAASYEQINILDDNPPELSDQSIEDGILTVCLEDGQSGIDYTSIYSVDSLGIQKEPYSIDRESGVVTFPMDPNGLVIHVKDKAGNEIIANCNVSNENFSDLPQEPEDE